MHNIVMFLGTHLWWTNEKIYLKVIVEESTTFNGRKYMVKRSTFFMFFEIFFQICLLINLNMIFWKTFGKWL